MIEGTLNIFQDTGMFAFVINWVIVTWYLIMLAVSIGVSILLAPDPPDINDRPGEVTNIPTCEQGTAYHIVFGRPIRTKATMVLWHGAARTYKWEDGDGARGFYYYMAFHFGLSHGHVDGIKQLWFDDRCFWPTYNNPTTYNADSAETIAISQFNAWGGKHSRGGLVLSAKVLYGGSDQLQDPTLVTYQDGVNTPFYKGITSIVFDDTCYWSNSPALPIMEVVLKRTDLHHNGTAMWYIAKANVDSFDSLNVVHVIRECLTSTIFGRGVSTDRIDSVTFEAAADVLYTEGIGVSYLYNPNKESMSKFLNILEGIMNGAIYYDHTVGLYKITLVREDYDEGALVVYNEDDFSISVFSRSSYFGIPSETIVKYSDIQSARPATVRDDDLSIMQLQGETPIPQSFNFPMITNPDTAAFIAAREQDQTSRNPAFIKLITNRSMYGIQRGDVFKISHPRLTKVGIANMVVRAGIIERGSLDDGQLTIDVVEEIFKSVDASTSIPEVPTPPSGDGEVVSSIATIAIINETVA